MPGPPDAGSRWLALRQLSLRLAVLLLLVGLLLGWAGARVEQGALPLLRTAVGLIDRDHRVESLAIVPGPNGRLLQLEVTRQRYVFVGTELIPPHDTARATARTLVGNLSLTLALLLAAAWAPPLRSARERLLRTLGSVLALPLMLALDLPMVLCAEIWRLYLNAYTPQAGSALVAWAGFMIDGGRYLLPVALGLAVAALSATATSATATAVGGRRPAQANKG